MSYNGSGTFNINSTGQPVVAGTVITASAFNALTTDLATGLTTAITKDGQTTTTARITFAQGITSSLTTDSSSVSTGSIITAGGAGIAKNLYVGGALDVAGATTFTNPVINNIKMGYTTTATAAGTTTLTVASNYRQFFTGSTTQTIVLPVTSTLVTGMAYEIENNSTGTLTVNSSGGNLVGTVPAGVCAHAVCIGTTLTTAADWDWDYISTTTITGTGANVLGTSPTITSPTLVTPALGTPASGVMTNVTGINYDGYKNRIINGAMVIDQRNAGASVSTSSGTSTYAVDRCKVWYTQTSKFTVQQNAGSVTPPSGFINYVGVTSSSAFSVGSTDRFMIGQGIEGLNVADLGWGAAGASTVTISFWVRSSLTGTFGGALGNLAGDRSYAFTYTISSANTWEYKTVTVAGDTTGSWPKDTSGGLYLYLTLGAGSSVSTTAGSWQSGFYVSATGATSVVGTNGATFYLTGVQLEKGSTATSFDYRPYGTELQLCQRYFETSYAAGTALGTSTTDGCASGNGLQGIVTTTEANLYVKFQTTKRGNPTIAVWDLVGNSNKVTRVESGVANNNNQTYSGIANTGTTGVVLYSISGSNCAALKLQFTASSEL